jgi:hypothetical protein
MALLPTEQRAALESWLAEAGELYVCLYSEHGDGSVTAFFCRAVNEIEELLAKQEWPELTVTIFRGIQYPLRGVVNEALLAEALQKIPQGQWFQIASMDHYYPSECVWYGSGNSHVELKQDLSEVAGLRVGIGLDPFERSESWTPDDVMVLNFKKEGDQYVYAQ